MYNDPPSPTTPPVGFKCNKRDDNFLQSEWRLLLYCL